MRILSRYYLGSYLGFFAASLLLALLLMTVVEMLVNFDEIVEHREAAGGALPYLLLRVPSLYLRDVVPAVSFIAAFLCLGLAARGRELTAIKTGGIAPLRVALPVLAAAAGLTAGALLINETLLLGATREFTRFENPDRPIVYRGGSFWYHRGTTFYNVREADRDAQMLHGVKMFSLDPRGRLRESIEAEQVEVGEDERWTFRQATRRRFDASTPTAPPQVEQLDEVVLDAAGGGDLDLLHASEHTLSLVQLIQAIMTRDRRGHDGLRYRAMLHERLAEPVSVLVFALLAIPIGLSVERTRSIAISAVYGIAVLAAFRAAWQIVTLLAHNGFAAAAIGPWLVQLAFLGLGGWLFLRAPR